MVYLACTVNTEKQDLGQNIVLHDTIPNDDTSYTPAQYIPETLKVYKANITVGTSLFQMMQYC